MMRPKYYTGKEVGIGDLYRDSIFYLLVCKDDQNNDFYLSNYPEFIEKIEEFFKERYTKHYDAKNIYSYEMFLEIMLEFGGLFYEFQKYTCKLFNYPCENCSHKRFCLLYINRVVEITDTKKRKRIKIKSLKSVWR